MRADLSTNLANALKSSRSLHAKDLASHQAALQKLEAAIAAGQPIATLLDLRSPITAALFSDPLVAHEIAAAATAPAAPVVPLEKILRIRTSPLLSGDPMTAAAKPDTTVGPFLSASGLPIWIDTFLAQHPTSIFVRESPAVFTPPQLVALLPIAHSQMLRRPALTAGSAWFPSRLFVHGRPENEFVGVRIKGGSFELAGTEQAAANSITLSGAWSVKLNLTLELPANPTPSAGVGSDVSHAIIHLPTTLTLSFSSAGLQVMLGDADATLYGDTVQMQRNASAPLFDPLSKSVVVPMNFQGDLHFSEVNSDLWNVSGPAKIISAGWSLPTLALDPSNLGAANGAGNLWFSFGSGLHAKWRGLPKATSLGQTVFVAAPNNFGFHAALTTGDVEQSLALWNENPPTAAIRSTVVFHTTSISTLTYLATSTGEMILATGNVTANFDRPLRADGERLAIAMPNASLRLVESVTDVTALISAIDDTAVNRPHFAVALKNALLKVRPASALLVRGALTTDGILSGSAAVRFALRSYLPTLPDPYAANFEFNRQQDTDQGALTCIITWATADAPELSFNLTQPSIPAPGQSTPGLPLGGDAGIQLSDRRFLIDVSSAADQFGVMLPIPQGSVQIDQLSVTAAGQDVAVVTLPPISWEPMLTLSPTGGGDIPLPAPPNDGGPALLSVLTAQASALDPASLLADFNAALNRQTPFNAWLPLPFGLVAQINYPAGDPNAQTFPYFPQNTFQTIRPVFDSGLTGGTQLSWAGAAATFADSRDPVIPGKLVAPNHSYAIGVLSENIFTELEADFGGDHTASVPVRRYDLSGYGASLRSDWRDPESLGPAIIHVNFDTLVGRTAHEVIQMQSFLYPHYARVVRTITMDRTAGGWILREDSGWVATSVGRFAYQGDPRATDPANQAPAFAPNQCHPGAIEAFTNIRNIQLQGDQFPIAARSGGVPTIWQQVSFDAEILFHTSDNPRLEASNGTSANTASTRGATGWIQITGPTYETHLKSGTVFNPTRPASGQEIFDLLATRGNAEAPLSCSLLLGGVANNPGMVFRASRVDVGCNQDSAAPHLVAAVMGSPVLPRDGAWSLARMAAGDPAPNALDPSSPVPLVAPNSAFPGFGLWHLADAADITQLGDGSAPAILYGLLQSLGTQKIFFSRPRINNDPNPVSFPRVPQLADMGSLLTAAGVFPGLDAAFDFGALKSLAVNAGEVGFSDSFAIGAPGSLKSATLADLGGADGIQLLINYSDEAGVPTQATITVNPANSPRWELELRRVSFAIVYRGAPLISLFARVGASETAGPQVKELVVKYEGILSALEIIFSNLQQVARFLPGGTDAGLQVGFSQGRLSVKNSFSLPNLPLGAGQITDVALALGFDVAISPFAVEFTAGIGSEQHPFNWVVSPLSGNGFVQVGITTDGLAVSVQAGLGLGLAIDLGIASGSASVALAIELTTEPKPFEVRGVLSGRASVDVLDGLVSATVTLSAGLGLIPPPQLFAPPFLPPQLLPPPDSIPSLTVGIVASVSVGIHVSVCWVADVDWDGYWQFRQDITTPKIPIPF